MPSGAQRWDGRTWLVRAAGPAVAVVAVGVLGGGVDQTRAAGWFAALAWLPLISLTEHVRLRRPALVATLVTILVDLLALLVIDLLAPDARPVLLVLLVPATLLHVSDLRWGGHAAAGGMLVAAQLVLAARGVDPVILAVVATLDVTALLLVARDVERSERRTLATRTVLDRADQLTGAVLAGVGEAVVVTDGAGQITSTNAAAEVTFGHRVAGACGDALALNEGATALDCSRGCPLLRDGQDVAQVDVRRAHPSGTTQALLANVQALRDPLGRVREVVHSYRDVTRMKQAEQAKTLFLATASHELKTPLAVMTGFAALLADDALDGERRQLAISTILSRGEQLTGIIDRLLLASRIEGGGITLATHPVDLGAVVTERVDALHELTDRDITLSLPDDRLPRVDGDETALATVIDHLVENATKYSPEGQDVTVTVASTDTTVVVDVSDEGVGMSADQIASCFEPFWQAETADTRRFGGSGVGLYIVRSLSRAMGGDTTVHHSEPGAGTTFRLHLPRTDAVHTPAPEPEHETATMMDEFLRQIGVVGPG